MSSRAADATIKGYYYQFDTSILKLLELLNDSDNIDIEGIEDIDINTATGSELIQCKYLSKPKFINSAVRDPIILMLNHFVDPSTPNNFKYVLYAHFKDQVTGSEPLIDLAKLKDILTYSVAKVKKYYYREHSINDTALNSFLANFKFIFGKEFSVQQDEVIRKLMAQFNCSYFEADSYLYNNALRVIIDKARMPDLVDRNVRRNDFLLAIDCKKKLFNEWFIKLRSKKEYISSIRRDLNTTRFYGPEKPKIIFIGNEILEANNSELPLISFIENLISKYYKRNVSSRSAKPLGIILDASNAEILLIKKQLIQNEISFNDGCEHINFSPSIFNAAPIITTSKNGQKLVNSSYLIKLIGLDTFRANFSSITPPGAFIKFSKDHVPEQFSSGQLIEIKYCNDLKEVTDILYK